MHLGQKMNHYKPRFLGQKINHVVHTMGHKFNHLGYHKNFNYQVETTPKKIYSNLEKINSRKK